MPARRGKPRGLASRIVWVTLLVGMATAAIAGTVALVSVSNLAAERRASRDNVALRLIEGTIEERLRSATGVLDRAATLSVAASGDTAVAESLSLLETANREIFSQLVVVRFSDASVLYSGPRRLTSADVRRIPAYASARRGLTGFSSVPSDEEAPEIWATRTAVAAGEEPVIIIARLDNGFIKRALRSAVLDDPERVALMLEGDTVVGSVGIGDGTSAGAVTWDAGRGGVGTVLMNTGGKVLSGHYHDVDAAGELSWRLVAAEPARSDALATLSTTIVPAGILVAGALLAALVGWVVTTRLLRPLRDLEGTARTAASGAYVNPLDYTGDDEVGRVAAAFNEVALRLNSLHDLSQLLASTSRLDHVLDGILSAMEHIVGRGSAAIYLVNGETLVPARTRGAGTADVQPTRMERGGWLARSLDSSHPVSLTRAAEELVDEIPGLSAVGMCSVIAAPLVAGNEPLGLVVVVLEEDVPVSDARLEMVRTFSAQAAVAVQTSRLFEIESDSRRIAEALRDVAERLVRPEALDRALRSVEDTIRVLFGASMVRVCVADPRALGLPAEAADDALRQLGLRVVDGRTEAIVVGHGEDADVDRVLDEYDAHQLLAVPIASESGHESALLAVLPGGAASDRLSVAGALADEIALALDNAYFYERAVARAGNLETIFRISQDVASHLQVNVVLNRVIDVVQKILSADAVLLWSFDRRKRLLEMAMARGDVPPGVIGRDLESGEELAGMVFASGKPSVLNDLSPAMGSMPGQAAEHELRSLVAVPLLARGRATGVLMVLARESQAFDDEDLNMLQTFASQAALALDTARLYSTEHEVAKVLQKSILPGDLPEFPEVDAGAVYAAASGDVEIGGDYYDLFRGPDGALWFAIGDVCGKGVHAATKTSMIKYSLRGLVAAGMPPGRAAAEVNRMAAETGDTSDIVTLWVGRYEGETGSLTWASGGHPPVILRRADGSEEELGPTGPILGAFRDVSYEEGNTIFKTGERLLLFTDGVTEARRGGEFFGGERAARQLSADRTPVEDARMVLQAVREFVNRELRDDVAVVVIAPRRQS